MKSNYRVVKRNLGYPIFLFLYDFSLAFLAGCIFASAISIIMKFSFSLSLEGVKHTELPFANSGYELLIHSIKCLATIRQL